MRMHLPVECMVGCVELQDRQHMQLLSPVLDHDNALYILTLGVLEAYRHQGVASQLINNVCQQAYEGR